MSIFVIILLIVFILSVTLGFTYNDKVAKKCFEIQKYSLIALCAVCVCGIISISSPRAIDVYRGKTALEITYRDSVPVDSTVVFKDK